MGAMMCAMTAPDATPVAPQATPANSTGGALIGLAIALALAAVGLYFLDAHMLKRAKYDFDVCELAGAIGGYRADCDKPGHGWPWTAMWVAVSGAVLSLVLWVSKR